MLDDESPIVVKAKTDWKALESRFNDWLRSQAQDAVHRSYSSGAESLEEYLGADELEFTGTSIGGALLKCAAEYAMHNVLSIGRHIGADDKGVLLVSLIIIAQSKHHSVSVYNRTCDGLSIYHLGPHEPDSLTIEMGGMVESDRFDFVVTRSEYRDGRMHSRSIALLMDGGGSNLSHLDQRHRAEVYGVPTRIVRTQSDMIAESATVVGYLMASPDC